MNARFFLIIKTYVYKNAFLWFLKKSIREISFSEMTFFR